MAAISDFFDGMHGVIFPFGGTTAPRGFLMCDGSAVSRTLYAALFAVIGVAFGADDGTTTFNVPDIRGRVIAGVDNMGGTAAGRLTSGGSGINGAALGAAGGEEKHTLSTGEMPSHNHALNDPGHAHSAPNGASYYTSGGSNGAPGEGSQFNVASGTAGAGTGITLNAAGGGGAHNNTQPTMVMNYVIKT